MKLLAALTDTVRLSHIVYPVWQTRPLSVTERAEVETVLTELERRLVPATAATVRALIEAAVKGGKSDAIADAQARVDQLTTICTGYSEAHLRASLAAYGGDTDLLATDLRRRRDNAETFRHRARVLLGLQTPHWWEVPGGRPPEPEIKIYDHPVFGDGKATPQKAEAERKAA
jgi:hypothetical protein